jgi:D-alanyl-D-alanine carboxypeptidase/D-alanyl-D-alanine-endopeptidase (penicillin-binding protein 4)
MLRASKFCCLLLTFLLSLQVAVASDHKATQKRIEELLADPDVAKAVWGIEVVDLNGSKVVYSLNADKLFVPASNTKLFTTSAVLALIGPEYRFRTTLESLGSVDHYGRLSGDLVIVGRGDPNLSGRTLPYNLHTERKLPPVRVLEELADQLVARGVKVIDGDLVADDSYFIFQRYGEGWAQDDLLWEWGAPVSALAINDNVIFVSVMPADRIGERAYVSIAPFADYYRIENRVTTTPAGTEPRKLLINREPGSNQLTLWGTIPLGDPGATEALAIGDPAEFTAKLMRGLLEKRGIVVYGQARAQHAELASLYTFHATAMASSGGGTDAVPPPLMPFKSVLAEHQSTPLVQDLKVINKVSQNLHAEMMLRLLGRERGHSGTAEGGLEVLRNWLLLADIHPDEYVFHDGSGLSRENLVTPHAVVKLLSYIARQPWGATYLDTLPVGGVDGSLAERFKNSSTLRRVQAKTGALSHVNSLSGYLTTLKGERLAFSIIVNNHLLNSHKASEMIDDIVTALIENPPKH